MPPQHRDVNPDDCPPCRRVFAALEDHQKAAPSEWLTTEEIGRAAGLKTRATQVHLAHLWARHRIDADRRTPLPGSTMAEPVLPGALDWASAVVAPDPTCTRCLLALARLGWEGQIHMEDLAREAGVSLRSVERHRPHLIRADLVQFRPVSFTDSATGRITREADRYTLLSQFTATPLPESERDAAMVTAAAVVRQVHWFTGGPEERRLAERSVWWFLCNGWPAPALLRALDATKDRRAFNPGGYLDALLRKLPLHYVLPAREVYTGQGSPRMAECPICHNAFRTSIPGRPLCGTGFCLDVADIAAQSIPPQGVPRETIPVRAVKSA
ncbi:hypothetical protein ACFWA9_10305 [Kitasatospora sp. NPDC059973]|uniref:hypothetical protein n=1 Tax=Kitasatospora sp. NPDC059973 TaxID=3347020 RepID=UPI00367E1B23